MHVDSYSKTAYNILMKEIPLILPTFKKIKREKIVYSYYICDSFFGFEYKGIFNYVHNKRWKA